MFGMELMDCQNLAVPREVMQHVVRVESSFNPYAIGIVRGRLARQPRTLGEAVATARMLEQRGYNFSVGLAQVNRYNLARQGLATYERAFDVCPNLQAGSRILAECHGRAGGSWGRAFSCYYSGNFTTGYRHGYVQKVFASMQGAAAPAGNDAGAIAVIPASSDRSHARPDARGLDRRRPAGRAPDALVAARSIPVSRRASAGADLPLMAHGERPGTAVGAAVAAGGAQAVAVLDAHGGPPRLVPRGAQSGADTSAAPRDSNPSDAAFVF